MKASSVRLTHVKGSFVYLAKMKGSFDRLAQVKGSFVHLTHLKALVVMICTQLKGPMVTILTRCFRHLRMVVFKVA